MEKLENLEEIHMRKRNMKLFPIYKSLSWDYIFFYTINFLFLTQIKNINPADVLIIDSFYNLFGIIAQIPATFIVEFLGRKKSVILANVLNSIYMLIIIFSKNLFDLITAEIISSMAFAIKEVADPSLLNESIPNSKSKSKIFAKINQKGASGYYILDAICKIIAGILFQINGYLPLIAACSTIILATIIASFFVEPLEKQSSKKFEYKDIIKDIKDGFKFVLTSERLKSLLVYSSITASIYSIMQTYEINILEELNISSFYIGILFAILGITSGVSSKKQEWVHKKYKNKSLIVIATCTAVTMFIVGISKLLISNIYVLMTVITIQYLIKYACSGLFYNLIEKYLRNFANDKIDTKIFAVNKLLKSIITAIVGIGASFLLNRLETAYCMIIVSIFFGILIFFMYKYMKTRVGLKPEEYNKNERKYDEIKD